MVSVRATAEEKQRIKAFAAELRRTHRYLTEADVLRELIGLEDTGLITPAMRKMLSTEKHEHDVPAESRFTNSFPGPHSAKTRIPSTPKKGGKK